MRGLRVFAVAALFAVAAVVGAAQGDVGSGTISGVVLNATCPGPCQIPPPPLPVYEGDNLTVVIRALPERILVARLHPKDGHFTIDVPPGLYRVRAFVGRAADALNCWSGSSRRALVADGLVTHKRLKVRNDCVV